MNRMKIKQTLRLKAPWIFNAWKWLHDKMQFNRSIDEEGNGGKMFDDATVWSKYFKKPFRAIDYYRIVFFNRKLAQEVDEVNRQMIYDSLQKDASNLTIEQFRKDHEKFMPELVLDLMKDVERLHIHVRRQSLMISNLNDKVFGKGTNG